MLRVVRPSFEVAKEGRIFKIALPVTSLAPSAISLPAHAQPGIYLPYL